MSQLAECIQKLASEDEADRIYAAEDIGYANDPAGVGPLLERLPAEPSRAVREAIFAALNQIENDAVIEGALALLDSEDSFLRNQSVELLQVLGAKTIPYLERAFLEGGRDRRKFVIDVIARLANPESLNLYRLALQDSDLNVVITAVENLGNCRQVRFREQVENLASRNAHPMLLSAAIEALAQIGDTGSPDVVRNCFGTPGGIPAYLRPSYLRLVGVNGAAADIAEVASFAGAEGLDSAVLNALTSLRNRWPGTPLPAVLAGPLMGMASRNQPPLGYLAVRLLGGLIQEPNVFDFICQCLDNADKVIRIGAMQALHEAGSERAETVLRDRLSRETDEEVLQACGFRSVE